VTIASCRGNSFHSTESKKDKVEFKKNVKFSKTTNQCLKYYRDRKKKINGDIKPFTVAESHFAKAKFFEEDVALKEIIQDAISSTGKGSVKNVKETRVSPGERVTAASSHNNHEKKRMSRQFQSHLSNKQISQQI